MYIPKIQTSLQLKIDDEYGDDDLGGDVMDLAHQEDEGDMDPDAFVGSRGSNYGGENSWLYDQFQLHSSQRKKHQLILLQVKPAMLLVIIIYVVIGLCVSD